MDSSRSERVSLATVPAREAPATHIELLVRARDAAASLSNPEFLQFLRHGEGAGKRMAPELTGRTGHAVDERADLYAVGALMYEWACGHPPFRESDPLALLRMQLAQAPEAPIAVRPGLPPAFSGIVMRLLEKEPARRYQSREGLVHDLDRLLLALRTGDSGRFELGGSDFPARLQPLRPAGRDAEIARLQTAVDAAARGQFQLVLVSGAAGVGKTALVNELRPYVVMRGGRFVSAKFEQFARAESGALFLALRELGRLLLAEAEEELKAQRAVLMHALGPQAALAAAIPEFQALLGNLPERPQTEPAHAASRAIVVALKVLRAVVSPRRPLVLMIDDVQWANAQSLGFLETLVDERDIPGLVLACCYREDGLPADAPLATALRRWQALAGTTHPIVLGDLPPAALGEMLDGLLRLGRPRSLELAQALAVHTAGNPYDTVELVNAWRAEGLLRWRDGWAWDAAALRRYVGNASVVDLLAARVGGLDPGARELVEVLACLRHDPSARLAQDACGIGQDTLESSVEMLVREGLLVRKSGPPPVIGLRHDRVQQAVYARLGDVGRSRLHRLLARRLAERHPLDAADQYLAVVEHVVDPAEAQAAALLLRAAAAQARRGANFDASLRMLQAALAFLARVPDAGHAGAALVLSCEVELHLSLCSAGLLQDADAVFARIEAARPDPITMAPAACAQAASHVRRGHVAVGLAMGLAFLRRLGIEVPDSFDPAAIAGNFAPVREWMLGFDPAREHARPQARAPDVLAAARMLVELGPIASSIDNGLSCWLLSTACSLWRNSGPCAPLAVALARIGWVATKVNEWRTGYLGMLTMLEFCAARGWAQEVAHCEYLLSATGAIWFERLEVAASRSERARRGFLSAGNLRDACLTYPVHAVVAFDSGRTLEPLEETNRLALDTMRRTGHEQYAAIALADRQLFRSLRGLAGPGGCFDDAEFSEARFVAQYAADGRMLSNFHVRRLVAAAIFHDVSALVEHAAAAGRVRPELADGRTPLYFASWLMWLGCIGQAWAARATGDAVARLPAMDTALDWLAARATDAPATFRHMHLHALAERAWAAGDAAGALALFAQALAAVEEASGTWHRAFLTECASRFHAATGGAIYGRALLFEAERHYAQWGAAAKSAQLRAELAALPHAATGADGPANEVDALAVLRAAQALGSERSTARLRVTVEEILCGVTGATSAMAVLWDPEGADWIMHDGAGARVSASASAHALPQSVLRYVERTHEQLVLSDALGDDRFARDPYFVGVDRCSLLAVPVVRHDELLAILLMENRAARAAFNAARLDAVRVIASQLAVSLENAGLYERLERKVAEQTRELRDAQSRLLAQAHRAGMAHIATNVLHNVGNVLTSVNVSAHLLGQRVTNSRSARVADLGRMLQGRDGDLAKWLAQDPAGRRVPYYVAELGAALEAERREMLEELGRLAKSVDHIKNVVATQQGYAGTSGVLENARITDLVEDALRLNADTLRRRDVTTVREYGTAAACALDKTRVMQVLVNLLENAAHAMESTEGRRMLRVVVRQGDAELAVSVADNGCGIPPEHLGRIFSHGFTTKSSGHGFGLHSCAVAAREMGGTLSVHSDGAGRGATFTLSLPGR